MTTIAASIKHKTIACDLQFTNGESGEKWKGKTKVYLFNPNAKHYPHAPFFVGFSGTARDMIVAADYLSNPDPATPLPDFEGVLFGLVLTFDGKLYTFDRVDCWLPVDQPHMAIGTGSLAARTALDLGQDPKQAVQAAMKVDAYTGYGVKVFTVPK